MRSALSIAVLAIALAGCSSFDLASMDTEGGDIETGLDTDPTDDSGMPDSVWVGLSGTISVSGGEADPLTSSLTWTFYDGDLTQLCALTVPLLTITRETPPTDEPIVDWWSITQDASVDDTACALPRPDDIRIGLGEVSPQLYPAMASAAFDADATTLYGLYAQIGWGVAVDDDTPLWIFGVGGTTGSYDGSVPAVADTPVPDGDYSLSALHLFATP